MSICSTYNKASGTENHRCGAWCSNRFSPLAQIGIVEAAGGQNIDQVSEKCDGWERVAIKIDSGAIDTVIPKQVASAVPIQETERSKSGMGFRAANGTHIEHFGQRQIRGYGDQYQGVSLTAQVADVKSALGSVSQMLRAGNRVHFETGGSYVEHIGTGRVTPIIEKNGMFEIGVWVQSTGEAQRAPSRNPDFARQGSRS